MKQVAGKIRLELAQYRELAAFAKFGSELDKDTQARLSQGEILMEILKQPQYAPVKVEHQVMIIYAAINKYLADIPVPQIKRFEKEFLNFMDTQYAEVGKNIKSSGKLDESTEEKLKAAIAEFKKIFQIE